MVSITDNLKEGLKYPLYEPKKVGILAALYFIIIFLVLGAGHVIFSSIRHLSVGSMSDANAISSTIISANNATVSGNIFNMIPAVNSAEAIILLIIALIVSLFFTGYLYRVIKFTIEGKNTLPEFNEFVDMLVSGIKLFIIGFVYSIIPTILVSIGLPLSSNPNWAIVGLIILIIGIILAIISALMEVMAMNNMAANDDSLRSAFEFKDVCHLICSIGWIRFIGALIFLILVIAILSIAVAIVSFIIGLICSLAGEIGIVIGLIIILLLTVISSSYFEIVAFRYCAALYNEAIEE